MLFRVALLAFLAGCAIALFVPIIPLLAYVLFLSSCLTAFFLWRFENARMVSVILFGLFLGMSRVALPQDVGSSPSVPEQVLGSIGQPLIGTVFGEPRIRGAKQIILLNVSEGGRAFVESGLYPRYRGGESLEVTCAFSRPAGSARSLQYFSRLGVSAVCRYPSSITHVGIQRGETPILKRAKDFITRTVNRHFPSPAGDLLLGIMIGADSGFSSALKVDFQRTGLSHIVAVSGSNIALVSLFLFRLMVLLPIPRAVGAACVIAGLVGYTLLTGSSSSTIRACVMGSLAILAPLFSRAAVSVNLLLFAAASMIVISPHALRDDLSFQLSFLATAGLLFLSPILEQKLTRIPRWVGLRQTMSQTLSALVFTTPFVLMTFQTVSLVALVSNMLVVPIVPLIMIGGAAWLGIASLATALGAPILAFISSWPLWLVVSEPIAVAQWFSALPFASVRVQDSGIAVLSGVLLYVILALWWYFLEPRKKRIPIHQ